MKFFLNIFSLGLLLLTNCTQEAMPPPNNFEVQPDITAINIEVDGVPMKANITPESKWSRSLHRYFNKDSSGLYHHFSLFKSAGEFGGTYQQVYFRFKTPHLAITDPKNIDKDYNFANLWYFFAKGKQPINRIYTDNGYQIDWSVMDETGFTQSFSISSLGVPHQTENSNIEIVKIKGISNKEFCVTYRIDCAVALYKWQKPTTSRLKGTIQIVYYYYPFKK